MSKKLCFKGSVVRWNLRNVCKNNNSKHISHELKFSCQREHNGKSLISVFQEFSASINKTFILTGRQGTRLSSYEF